MLRRIFRGVWGNKRYFLDAHVRRPVLLPLRGLATKAKSKVVFVCNECGHEHPKWAGQCASCGAWSSLKEFRPAPASNKSSPSTARARAGVWSVGEHHSDKSVKLESLGNISNVREDRVATGCVELDRVFGTSSHGAGLALGSVVLLAGSPGVGKSTLALQMAAAVAGVEAGGMCEGGFVRGGGPRVAYISGEESASQVKGRAERLRLSEEGRSALRDRLLLLNETSLDTILEAIYSVKDNLGLVVVDSIQTTFLEDVGAAAGSVTQVRECALRLLHMAKATGVPIVLVGHVTKSGDIAGPRVLEHLVDTVLQIDAAESEYGSGAARVVRASKNRFGATGEVAVLDMASDGLRESTDPARAFVGHSLDRPGCAISAAIEGSRALCVEVQALAAPTPFEFPRHRARGMALDRVHMLLAVLSRHARIPSPRRQDIFLNVAGGLRLQDPGADLAAAAALASTIFDKPLPPSTAFIGEVGLSGELRPVPLMAQRIASAHRLGIQTVVVAKSHSIHENDKPQQNVIPMQHLSQLVSWAKLA